MFIYSGTCKCLLVPPFPPKWNTGIYLQWNLCNPVTIGAKFCGFNRQVAALEKAFYTFSACFISFQGGCFRQVTGLHRWPLIQVPLYIHCMYVWSGLLFHGSLSRNWLSLKTIHYMRYSNPPFERPPQGTYQRQSFKRGGLSHEGAIYNVS